MAVWVIFLYYLCNFGNFNSSSGVFFIKLFLCFPLMFRDGFCGNVFIFYGSVLFVVISTQANEFQRIYLRMHLFKSLVMFALLESKMMCASVPLFFSQ